MKITSRFLIFLISSKSFLLEVMRRALAEANDMMFIKEMSIKNFRLFVFTSLLLVSIRGFSFVSIRGYSSIGTNTAIIRGTSVVYGESMDKMNNFAFSLTGIETTLINLEPGTVYYSKSQKCGEDL